MMNLHLLGLHHVPVAIEVTACAFTQKIRRLAKMLTDCGHNVTLYGAEGSKANCAEVVQAVNHSTIERAYGKYSWREGFFRHDTGDEAHREFCDTATREIRKRLGDRDVLLATYGNYHKPIADATGILTVEPGIGYSGVFSRHLVFESHAWRHHIYGQLGETCGRWYDAVIPNTYDPSEFPYEPTKGDYFLYMGRIIPEKGVEAAVLATERIGAKLLVAGQGWHERHRLGMDYLDKPHVEYVGCLGLGERETMLGQARAAFVPTCYIEPFGGVAVEAQLCGTPAITSDFGAFPETVLHGETGFRCSTVGEFAWAAEHAGEINASRCREWAISQFSTQRGQKLYDAYFRRLATLWGDGWYDDGATSIHDDFKGAA